MERLRKNFVKFLFLSVILVYVCVCDHRNKFEGVFNGKKRIFKEVMGEIVKSGNIIFLILFQLFTLCYLFNISKCTFNGVFQVIDVLCFQF